MKLISVFLYIVGALAGILILVFLLGTLWGWDNIWVRTAGPADQGAISFAGLKKNPKPNQAIMAPANLVERTQIDVVSPVYGLEPPAILTEMEKALKSMGDFERVDDGSRADYRRYVFRSKYLRFPDTVDVLGVPATSGSSHLAIYSRSQVGESDFGVNLARIRKIASALKQFEQ